LSDLTSDGGTYDTMSEVQFDTPPAVKTKLRTSQDDDEGSLFIPSYDGVTTKNTGEKARYTTYSTDSQTFRSRSNAQSASVESRGFDVNGAAVGHYNYSMTPKAEEKKQDGLGLPTSAMDVPFSQPKVKAEDHFPVIISSDDVEEDNKPNMQAFVQPRSKGSTHELELLEIKEKELELEARRIEVEAKRLALQKERKLLEQQQYPKST
jgi:hypothetical protein